MVKPRVIASGNLGSPRRTIGGMLGQIEMAGLARAEAVELLKRAGLLSDSTRGDMIPPIPIGALGSLFPKPQACYLGFGQPISLSSYRSRKPTKAQLKRIRNDVAEQIEEQLAELLLLREQSRREDGLLRRLLTI